MAPRKNGAIVDVASNPANILLPAVHPHMGTPYSAADEAPLLESPGFMLLNYGRATPIATVLAHMAYGAIVGYFTAAGS